MEKIVQPIITFIGVYFAAWLALRNHTYVRWGEQRQKAYQELIDALYHRAEYYSHQAAAYQEGESILPEMEKTGIETHRLLKRARAMGDYLISEEAALIIRDAIAYIREPKDWAPYELWGEHETRCREALEALKVEAKKDLGLKQGVWQRALAFIQRDH